MALGFSTVGGGTVGGSSYQGIAPPAPDTSAPTMNGALTFTNITQTGFTINWLAASDDIGVAGYDVDNGSGSYSSLGNVLSLVVSGKIPATPYAARVRARDLAGNVAQVPLTDTVTTQSGEVEPDPEIPAAMPIEPVGVSTLRYSTLGTQVRIVLTFSDTPAPRDRTIILGGQSRTITSG